MVGERYRELINTADTIAEMENTVKDIRTTLDSIQTSCKLGTVSCRISPEMFLKWQPFKDLTYCKATNSPPKFLNQNSMYFLILTNNARYVNKMVLEFDV